jgi:hypothetical protein
MSALVEVVAVIGIVGYVIARQLAGEPLRGRRVILLPAILTVIGVLDLHSSPLHARPADVGCLVVGGLLVAGIGVAQAGVLRLESRDGYLWAQLPVRGLWLWLALIATRVAMTLAADGLDAKLAAASSTILLMLGINRLGQALVVIPRARRARIAFAPEKNGRTFLPALTGRDPAAGEPGQSAVREMSPRPSTRDDRRADRRARHDLRRDRDHHRRDHRRHTSR